MHTAAPTTERMRSIRGSRAMPWQGYALATFALIVSISALFR